jgi:signal transduction histidine kinase
MTAPAETKAPCLSDQRETQDDRWLEIFSIFIHDLESPLASVKYLIKLMEEGRLDLSKELHRQLVGSAGIAVRRAESIIYDILAIAKAGKVGLPVNLTTLIPDTVVREAVGLASGSAQENEITISYANGAVGVSVEADPELLQRTIDNLIYNAIRHTPRGGRIEVTVESGRECIFIHVKDSGQGLGDINPEALFEKFGQVEYRAQGKHRGVGLGLYFCRLAAQGMGGTVIASDHADGGAVFSVKLRKAKE